MRTKFTDLTGQRFGSWTVVAYHDKRSANYRWLCRCACGDEHVVWQHSLKQGRSTRCRKCVPGRYKHGYGRDHGHAEPTYSSWRHMLDRCLNPKSKDWPNYGGRGITVCERWQGADGFANFLADVGHRPRDYLGRLKWLDRRDNTGDYEPYNVRWATPLMQQRNKGAKARIMPNRRVKCSAMTLLCW